MSAGSPIFEILVAATLLIGLLTIYAELRPRPRLAGKDDDVQETSPEPDRIRRSKSQWKELLSEEQYRIARCGGTERPFTGQYNDHHEQGIYTCVCCESRLFDSAAKYDSGSGWPSFRRPVSPEAVKEIKNISYGMVRTEIICDSCEAHLGHVFADGPKPTGLRYCINSASLGFVKVGTGPVVRKAG